MSKDYYLLSKDLMERAKTTGMYKMFLFDVKNSRSIVDNNKYVKYIQFIDSVTKEILEKEKQIGKQIFHRYESLKDAKLPLDKNKVYLAEKQSDITKDKNIFRIDQVNPLYWLGDTMQFIVKRDSISDEEFYSIIQKHKDNIMPDIEFHHASAFYETDNWMESHKYFSRNYCVPVLDYLSKKNKKTIKTEHNLKK